MRIRYIFVLSAVIIIFLFNQPVFAGTKYDQIISNPGWKKMMVLHQDIMINYGFLIDYYNLLINKNDLKNLIEKGKLEKEDAEFIEEHLDEFTKYMQLKAGQLLHETKKNITDKDFITSDIFIII